MSKTYLKMIFVTMVLTFFLAASFAFSADNLFQKYLTDLAYQKNIEELSIMSSLIQYNHDTIQSLTYQLSSNSSLNAFIQTASMRSPEGYRTMMNLSSSLRANPLIHSVSLYSGYSGEYFSTLTSLAGADPFLQEMVTHPDSDSILQPVYRKLPFDIYNTSDAVFSYFYFETGLDDRIATAIALNLDADWLFDYLKKLKGNNSSTYIVDLYNNSILDNSMTVRQVDDGTYAFVQRILSEESPSGCFVEEIEGENALITYQLLQAPHWILITEEPNTGFQDAVHAVHISLLIIMCVLCAAGFVYALLVFYRLYQPWGKIYRQAASDKPAESAPSRLYDDVEAINQSFQLTRNQLADYMNYKNSTKTALFTSYIRALIQEDSHLLQKFTASDRAGYESFLSQPLQTAIFRIDHWAQIKSSLTGSSDACMYSFIQISDHFYPRSSDVPSCHWIYLTHGKFLLLARPITTPPESEVLSWPEQAAAIQQFFSAQTGMAVAVSIGGRSEDIGEFMRITRAALERMNASILLERQCVLEQDLDNRAAEDCPYDEISEKALFNAISKGQMQKAVCIFDDILSKYKQCSLQTFILHLTQLFLHLDKYIGAANKSQGLPAQVTSFYRIIQISESLDDIRERFIDELEKAPTHDEQADFKTNALITSIEEYIRESYAMDISLKSISARFNFSSGYLGNLFKTATGRSIYEYINEVRLDAAAQMLLDSSQSTISIMQKCGFINESNFYRQFKTRFGVTPKTYREEKKGGQ